MSRPVGCMTDPGGCPDALGLAQDLVGGIHRFADLCIPPGWSMRQRDGLIHEDLPACSTPTAAEHPHEDTRVILGGMFSQDHIGPAAHARVVKHVRARPLVYLAELEGIMAEASASPPLLAAHHPHALLALIEDLRPEETRAVARGLRALYQRALDTRGPATEDQAQIRAKMESIAHLAR